MVNQINADSGIRRRSQTLRDLVEGIKYAIRLPANRILQERIGYLLKRPVPFQ